MEKLKITGVRDLCQQDYGGPRILFWDIETSYILAYVFGLFEERISYENIKQDWFIICAAWKWGHESLPVCARIKDAPNDYGVVKIVHDVLSKADVLVHHNGDQFDLKKFNARAISYGLDPIPPLTQIDTLKIARKHFKFTSNRLDYLGEFLGVGRKLDTPKGLWKLATEGDQDAIKQMATYNKQDVLLLEEVYNKLKPYTPSKINLNYFIKHNGKEGVCPKCGSADTIKMGRDYSYKPPRQKVKCKSCGGWHRISNGWAA